MPHVNSVKRKAERRKESRAKRQRTLPLYETQDVALKFAKEKNMWYIKRSTAAITEEGKKVHYIRGAFLVEDMRQLAIALRDAKTWEWREDRTRGNKNFFITGNWTEQGHAGPGDSVFPAGKAGKKEAETGIGLNIFLQSYAVVASNLLRKLRPDVVALLADLKTPSQFDLFHLFMSPEGTAKMHKDRNDLVAFLFLIDTDENCGGGLEIGGTDYCFNWRVGDAIILDSWALAHGTRKYLGEKKNRLLGIFVIQKPYLRVHSIEI